MPSHFARVAALQSILLFAATAAHGRAQDWQQIVPARSGHAIAYDEARGRTVLFGGSAFELLGNDTWECDGTRWTRRSLLIAPSPRRDYGFTYDSRRQCCVLFGGLTDQGAIDDTWEYDGQAWTHRLFAHAPVQRSGTTLAFDTGRGCTVLYGGNVPTIGEVGDTWEYDGTAWRQSWVSLFSLPGPRVGHGLVYLVLRSRQATASTCAVCGNRSTGSTETAR